MFWALSLAVKSTLVLGAATAAAWALGRSSASTRHALWSLALLSLGALAVLSAVLPPLGLPLLPAAPNEGLQLGTLVVGPAGHSVPMDVVDPPLSLRVQDWVLLAWLVGAGLALIQLASGSLFVALAVRGAQPVTAPEWMALLDEARTSLGIQRRVEVRFSRAVDVPNVWGHGAPVILLPLVAASWPEDRRRAILLHELAHVARYDYLTQTLAYVVRAVYWPHPLVWWSVSSLRREAEQACDDRVLHAGTPAADYARHLLEAARGLARPTSRFLLAAAGAEGTRLGDRVRALLDEDRDRSVPTESAMALLGGATLLAVALLAAALPVAARTPDSPSAQAATAAEGSGWIVHNPFGCLIEKRYPEIDAVVEPASDLAEARVYFNSAAGDQQAEYWVKMTWSGDRFVGRLPKPQATASPVRYRIEGRRADGRVESTKEHVAVVAVDESGCPRGARIAPEALSTEPVTVHRVVSGGQ